MTPEPIKLSIAALGGQGGGVLAEWLIEIAEAEGYLAQSTSPGTGMRAMIGSLPACAAAARGTNSR